MKQKKKILNLEDEMLTNHATILELQKEIAALKNERLKITGNQPNMPKIERKAS